MRRHIHLPRRRWLRVATYLALIVAACFVLAAVIVWRQASQMLLPANRPIVMPATELPIEAVTIPSDSGSMLAAWYVPAAGAKRTVILLHGLRSSRLAMFARAEMFHRRGLSVLLIDFQSHGESPGDGLTLGYLEQHDVRAAVAFAKEKNPAHRIIVLGRSLGGAAALLASPLGIDAIIVESVYSTLDRAIENRLANHLGPLGRIAAPLFTSQSQARLRVSTDELRPIDRIASAACPVLVMGGALDQHTTIDETRALFAAAAEPKQLLIFDRAAHVDFFKFDRPRYEAEVLNFIDRHGR